MGLPAKRLATAFGFPSAMRVASALRPLITFANWIVTAGKEDPVGAAMRDAAKKARTTANVDFILIVGTFYLRRR